MPAVNADPRSLSSERVQDLLLTGEAAAYLGVTAQVVRKLNDRGKVACLRTAGGLRLFERAELERLRLLLEARPSKRHPLAPRRKPNPDGQRRYLVGVAKEAARCRP